MKKKKEVSPLKTARLQVAMYTGLTARMCSVLELGGTTPDRRLSLIRKWLEENDMNGSGSTAMQVQRNQIATLDSFDMNKMKEQAQMLIDSGLLPDKIETPEQAIVISLTGQELGLPPMQSLRSIQVIKGVPTMAAELMLSMAYKNASGFYLTVKETTKDKCVVEASRASLPTPHIHTFTWEDAKSMDLTSKFNWKAQPATMLRWRCISACLRIVCPDAIGKCYTPEEINPDIQVVDETQVSEAPTVEAEIIQTDKPDVGEGIIADPPEEQPDEDADAKASIADVDDPRIPRDMPAENVPESSVVLPEDASGEPEAAPSAAEEAPEVDEGGTTELEDGSEPKIVGKPLDEATSNSIIEAFSKHKITEEQLVKNFGKVNVWTEVDRKAMLSVYSDLSAGKKPEEILGDV